MSEKKKSKAAVTLRAVIVRIRRRVAADHLAFRVARDKQGYYLVDLTQNTVKPLKQDIESYARKLGALADWEEIA